jgi:hypothetical protein
MKFHRRTGLLVAAVSSVIALAGGAGIAQGQPSPPPVPSTIDEPPPPPTQWPNPDDQGGPMSHWPGVGVLCENQWLICRLSASDSDR